MRPTFEKTVKVLVQAFINDTLIHRDCSACAVGNIIHAGGYRFKKDGSISDTHWLRLINNKIRDTSDRMFVDEDIANNQISVTGYSTQELSDIENAFEMSPYGESKDDWIFNGLMAVVDVLAEIHGISLEQKQEAKALFVKV